MSRRIRLILRIVLAALGFLVLLGAVAVWRLSASPVSSTFLTPYIESAIDRFLPGTRTSIEHTLLVWDNADFSLALRAGGVEVKDEKGGVIAAVPHMFIRWNVLALAGLYLPTELVIEHPQVRVERKADGRLVFGGMESAPDSAAGGETASRADDGADVRSSLRRAAAGMAHAWFTRRIDVTRAVFDVVGPDGAKIWSVSIPEIALERASGQFGGHAAIDLTQKNGTAALKLNYAYDRKARLHVVSGAFEDVIPSELAGGHPEALGLVPAAGLALPISGAWSASFDADLALAAATADVRGGAGELRVPALWDKPRAVTSLAVKASYDHAAGKLNIASAAIDFGGPTLDLSLDGKESSATLSPDLAFELSVKLKDWPASQFETLWPKPVIPNARAWIASSITKGKFDRADGRFKGSLSWDKPEELAVSEAEGAVAASGASVAYIDGMPPVQGVNAEASFTLKDMTVKIQSGNLGTLRVVPFALKLTNLDEGTQYADIPLKVEGPLPDILKLIDAPPLGYARAVGLDPQAFSGRVEGEVSLRFPLLKTLAVKDIAVEAKATASGLAAAGLLKGVAVTDGKVSFDLDKEGFLLKGPALFNGVPLALSWRQNFEARKDRPLRQASLEGAIRGDQWEKFGITALAGTQGATSVRAQLTENGNGKSALTGKADMTAADIHVAQANWIKPAGAAAILTFSADLPGKKDGKDAGIEVTSISLEGAGIGAEGKASLAPDGTLRSLGFDSLRLGRTDAAVYFARAGEEDAADDRADRYEVYGHALDVSGLGGGGKASAQEAQAKGPDKTPSRPAEYHIKLDHLYTGANGFLAKVEGTAVRDRDGWSSVILDGLADGGPKLSVRLMPRQGGGRSLSIACDDFGKALKGLGLSETVSGGGMRIDGASMADDPQTLEGAINIGAFSVKDLPVLMLLLNATSPFGFTGIFTDSVSFDHMKGGFRWNGDKVSFQRVNAAGSAVGLTVDGPIDMGAGTLDLRGTLVPFSMVNRILGSIPLIGDLITGGEGGGVLAVSYAMNGSLNDPKVSVNPISLLTPGFLRNLFFSGSADEKDEKGGEVSE